jgi:hypothetical protein
MPEEARMPPLPHAEREPELDNLRSVTRITGTVLNRSDSAFWLCRSAPGTVNGHIS